MIERHLRYLMLYQAFGSIKTEAAANSDVEVDKRAWQSSIRVNVGSIVAVELGLEFFAPGERPVEGPVLMRPEIFKQILQSLMENTYSASVMNNLGFLLVNKFMTLELQALLAKKQEVGALRNASCILSRLKWDKKVDTFKSITFTLLKETDLFFASIKNQKWAQDELDPTEVVKNRYL